MKRTVPGILIAAAWLLLIIKGSFLLFWAAVLLIGFIGSREYSRMAYPNLLYETDRIILAVIFSVPILVAVFAQHQLFRASLGVLLAFVAMICYSLYHYSRFENPLTILNRGILGILFVGFLASHLPMLRSLTDGVHWLVFLSAVTAGTDTCAYYIGCRWGKRKLCPSISPNKTVEGAIGGVIGGMSIAILVSIIFRVPAGFFTLLVLAGFLSILGMLGDLFESIIKRGTGFKDSGTLLRGHGGILDRVDSLFFTAPFLYYILIYSGF